MGGALLSAIVTICQPLLTSTYGTMMTLLLHPAGRWPHVTRYPQRPRPVFGQCLDGQHPAWNLPT